jgi:two-component system cell cycle response regulator
MPSTWVSTTTSCSRPARCAWHGVKIKKERLAWILVGSAVLAWGVGNTVWTFTVANLSNPPFPSYADIGFLAVYPPAYVAIVLLLRSRAGQLRASLWLDGVIGGLAIAAAGTAVVFQAVLGATGGSRAAVATNLAYPLADLALIALVVWALAATGWRPGRTWGFVAAGLLVFSVSDCLYLYQTAVDSYTYGSPTDLGWVAGGVLLAWAAWQPAGARVASAIEGWPLLFAPVLFGLLGLGVLVYDHFHPVNVLSVVLSTLAILGVIARMALTFAENMRMLVRSRVEARTDVLTGLGNRRKLLDDLERLLDSGQTGAVLALFDLNGFKHYNDSFGHLAGDTLLARLGENLSGFAAGRGTPYRIGGDEFCLLLDRGDPASAETVAAAATALEEHGDGFAVSAAFGAVLVPSEASTPTDLLRLADQRMYAQKADGRQTAREQSSGVLLSAFSERHPRLIAHVTGVAILAEAVAVKLGLDDGEVARTRLAGALHDIGKMAIPDDILAKPGPLTDQEWAFVSGHTLIGERILRTAPALSHIAGLVRSSHERFDGGGYPDGLVGTAIPPASRIVAVCNAFETMVSSRPFAERLDPSSALVELRRSAGTQFDPVVLGALAEVVADRATLRGSPDSTELALVS